MSPRTRGWTTRPSFVRGDKMEMPGSGRYRGNPVDSTVSRRECEGTKAYKGVIRICPFVPPPALKAMFPTLMPKKSSPIYFSGRSHIGTIYMGADKIQRWLIKIFPFFRLHDVSIGSNDSNLHERCNPSTIILSLAEGKKARLCQKWDTFHFLYSM